MASGHRTHRHRRGDARVAVEGQMGTVLLDAPHRDDEDRAATIEVGPRQITEHLHGVIVASVGIGGHRLSP